MYNLMLYFSAKESNLEVTQFLIDNYGANVDEALEIAAQHSNIVAAQFLINHYVSSDNYNYRSPTTIITEV